MAFDATGTGSNPVGRTSHHFTSGALPILHMPNDPTHEGSTDRNAPVPEYAPGLIEAKSRGVDHVVEGCLETSDRDVSVAMVGSCGRASSLDDARGIVIADAYARFRKAQGNDVLVVIDSAAEHVGALSSQDTELDRLQQVAFVMLHDAGLVYRRADLWYLNLRAYNVENDRRLDSLAWSDGAVASQRTLLGRIDGVELDLTSPYGSKLTVFTEHPGSVGEATFVALSPNHPEIDAWWSDEASRETAARLAVTSSKSGGDGPRAAAHRTRHRGSRRIPGTSGGRVGLRRRSLRTHGGLGHTGGRSSRPGDRKTNRGNRGARFESEGEAA